MILRWHVIFVSVMKLFSADVQHTVCRTLANVWVGVVGRSFQSDEVLIPPPPVFRGVDAGDLPTIAELFAGVEVLPRIV